MHLKLQQRRAFAASETLLSACSSPRILPANARVSVGATLQSDDEVSRYILNSRESRIVHLQSLTAQQTWTVKYLASANQWIVAGQPWVALRTSRLKVSQKCREGVWWAVSELLQLSQLSIARRV